MFNQSDVLLYGGCIPALKEATLDTNNLILGAGLTLTELDQQLTALETKFEGREKGQPFEY